jgi:hypothetical protein
MNEDIIKWVVKVFDGRSISVDEARELSLRLSSREALLTHLQTSPTAHLRGRRVMAEIDKPGAAAQKALSLDVGPHARSNALRAKQPGLLLRQMFRALNPRLFPWSAPLPNTEWKKYYSADLPADSLSGNERDRYCNNQDILENFSKAIEDERNLYSFRRQLPDPGKFGGRGRVPRVFHFVHGFRDTGDLPYYVELAITSALHFNPGWSAIIYCMNEPSGPNWDRVKQKITTIKVPQFEFFRGAHFRHYAHKADVIRLIVINQVGGVYLDTDTITQKSFEDLRDANFCMGVQSAGPNSAPGLCNAVMIGQAGADFSTRWLEHYDYFRSKGRDDLWDFHSVKLPMLLAQDAPETIRVLSYRAFFFPLWTGIEKHVFSEDGPKFMESLSDSYCFHLWNGATESSLLRIDKTFVQRSKSIYAVIARQVEGISYEDTASIHRHADVEFGKIPSRSHAFTSRTDIP